MIGTWNVRGLKNKEEELKEDFDQINNDILANNETKKKETNRFLETNSKNMLVYKGINQNTREEAGVTSIIKRKLEKNITKWKTILGRIMVVILALENAISIITYRAQTKTKTERERVKGEQKETFAFCKTFYVRNGSNRQKTVMKKYGDTKVYIN